jgi:LysM repeat protein
MSLNGLSEHSIIHPGDILRIPGEGSARTSSVDAQETQSYTVQTGDSLWVIAERLNVSLSSLMHLNGLSNGSVIHSNQTLKVPGVVYSQVVARAAQKPATQKVQQEGPKLEQGQTTQKDPAIERAKKSSGSNGYNVALGKALAAASMSESRGRTRAGGMCYFGVANAVDRVIGRFLSGNHAYTAASQFASRKDLFTETSAGNLRSLPAGAIVVWGRGTSASGHISIAQGNGMETSDFIGAQMTYHYGGASARVFLPKSRM